MYDYVIFKFNTLNSGFRIELYIGMSSIYTSLRIQRAKIMRKKFRALLNKISVIQIFI